MSKTILNGSDVWDGFLVEIIQHLAQEFNFRWVQTTQRLLSNPHCNTCSMFAGCEWHSSHTYTLYIPTNFMLNCLLIAYCICDEDDNSMQSINVQELWQYTNHIYPTPLYIHFNLREIVKDKGYLLDMKLNR